MWFELRYCRITASKIYELSRCKKGDGILVKQILGCSKIKLTSAMERGQILEKYVSRTNKTIVLLNFYYFIYSQFIFIC